MSDTYTDVLDRDGWGSGPWDGEPDKVTWVDDETDLDCMIRRGGGGAWCGYVGVPPDHPLHGVSYYGCAEDPECDDGYECGHTRMGSLFEVHGALTFAASCNEEGDPAEAICHIPEPGRPDDVWWFGFDCSHAGDLRPRDAVLGRQLGFDWRSPRRDTYRDQAYVTAETLELARQLAAFENVDFSEASDG